MVLVMGVGLMISILSNVFECGYGIMLIVDYFILVMLIKGFLVDGSFY